MPGLLSRVATPRLYAPLAVPPLRASHTCTQVRCRHDGYIAELDSSHSQHQPALNEEGRPVRQRRHGFRSLPLSPLMAESRAARVHRRSEPQTDGMKEMQKEVAVNPFAHALATPVRSCRLTRVCLPSHFLLPFTTTVSRLPATANDQPFKVKAALQPGCSSDYEEDTLAETSHVMNRQDIVRHLSRKYHWSVLITEKQKAKLASIARRSPSSKKLVKDHWVWDDRVHATAGMLEGKVITAVKKLTKTSSMSDTRSKTQSDTPAFAMLLDAGKCEPHTNGDTTVYDLPSLLSPETLQLLQDSVAQDSGTVYISKSAEACQAQLALSRLKAYKDSNEIFKELHVKQDPKGSREARLRKEEPELGDRPTEDVNI